MCNKWLHAFILIGSARKPAGLQPLLWQSQAMWGMKATFMKCADCVRRYAKTARPSAESTMLTTARPAPMRVSGVRKRVTAWRPSFVTSRLPFLYHLVTNSLPFPYLFLTFSLPFLYHLLTPEVKNRYTWGKSAVELW